MVCDECYNLGYIDRSVVVVVLSSSSSLFFFENSNFLAYIQKYKECARSPCNGNHLSS